MWPILMILLPTGMRKGELANLEWRDVDFERGVIKITPKAGWMPKEKRGREIPIGCGFASLLQHSYHIWNFPSFLRIYDAFRFSIRMQN